MKVLFVAGFGPIVKDQKAREELEEKGYTLLVEACTELLKQIATRMLSPDDMVLLGITFTPWMRE